MATPAWEPPDTGVWGIVATLQRAGHGVTRAGHRAAAAAGGVGWVTVNPGVGPEVWLVVTVVAVVTAGGVFSPDVDVYPGWRATVGGWLPWSGHRQVTHWWVWPVLAWLVGVFAPVGDGARWALVGVAVGWGSHVLVDGVFGGVPVWPGSRRVGLGLRTGGRVETWVVVPVLTLGYVVGLVWVVAGRVNLTV